MFKLILAAFVLNVLAFPALAGPGHDHSDHDHGKTELVITPITSSKLKAGEENNITLFIQDKQARLVDVSQFEVVHTRPVHFHPFERIHADCSLTIHLVSCGSVHRTLPYQTT